MLKVRDVAWSGEALLLRRNWSSFSVEKSH